MKPINVTKAFMPPQQEYQVYLDKIWSNNHLTNQGPLLKELERAVKQKLGIDDYEFHFVTNGTLALQIALKSLGINDGEIITTPFSYVATVSSILWERCDPVFVDIESGNFCIDAEKIEAAITPETKAIMAVHVFGHACDIEKIQDIATRHNLKVIYDAAHAFGVQYKGKSIFEQGDISICSFHSTKLFHTIEGGGVFVKDKAISDKLELIKRFGHHGDDHKMLGLNAKASEFQAAMGLCNLGYIDKIIEDRKKISNKYDELLDGSLVKPMIITEERYNYAYYPIVFNSENEMKLAVARLNDENIFPRRYFYPSLNTLPYLVNSVECPQAEDIASRIVCLPLYDSLEQEIVEKICQIVNQR